MSWRPEHLILSGYLLGAGFLLSRHEPWRDESQAWLIARDVAGLGELFRMMGYEGTPALWHLFLMPFAKSGAPYASMGVLVLCVMGVAMWVFLRHAPFSLVEKGLFAFGYLVFYEYGVIARSYSLTVCLLFLLAAVHPRRRDVPIAYSVLLVLLANTNVHSTIFAIAIFSVDVAESVIARRRVVRRVAAGWGVVAFGIAIAGLQMSPPPDLLPTLTVWRFEFSPGRLRELATTIASGFLPLSPSSLNFWGATWVRDAPVLGALVGIALYAWSIAFLRRDPRALAIYLIGSLGILSIFYLKYMGYLRHHGLIYVLFVFSVWISRDRAAAAPSPESLRAPRARRGGKRRAPESGARRTLRASSVLVVLFAANALGSAVPLYQDSLHEFSAGESLARFLDSTVAPGDFVAAYPAFVVASALPYLPAERARFFALEFGEERSFAVWSSTSKTDYSVGEVIRVIDEAATASPHDRILLVTNTNVGSEEFLASYRLVTKFDGTIVFSESFYVYERIPVERGEDAPRESEEGYGHRSAN